jgi:HK97 gp10 family phage protein
VAETHVKGLAELQKVLDQVPVKVEKNIMRGALRAGVNVIKPVAQSNIHSVSGELARGLRVGTRSRGGTVTASLKARGKHGFVAKWVEFGTAAHSIKARLRKGMAFAGAVFRSVDHPGARPRPFMRPAMDSQAQGAVIAAAEYMKARLAKKEGLDTSHIMIEGDEP